MQPNIHLYDSDKFGSITKLLERQGRSFVQKQTFPQGTLLYSKDHPVEGFYLIQQGAVVCLNECNTGERIAFGLYGRGTSPALFESLIEIPYFHSTVESIFPTTALYIKKEPFLKYIQTNDQVRMLMIQYLNEQLRQIYTRQWTRHKLTGHQRVALLLSELCLLLGNECSESSLHLRAQDVARLAGISKTYIYTILSKFKREGAIRNDAGGLRIMDVGPLQMAAQG